MLLLEQKKPWTKEAEDIHSRQNPVTLMIWGLGKLLGLFESVYPQGGIHLTAHLSCILLG